MPTQWSKTLIPTLRQVPAEAEVPSHQLMLRAGMIRRLGSGMYDYLPLGLRSLRKVMAIIRQEMDQTGAIEVLLPTLQPIELWEKTGRRTAYGDNLFVVKDRHNRELALGPTHEEVMTELACGYIESYRQLPLTLYQIQTKFRDEFRPRFGILRSREFQMKDAYSFDMTTDGLNQSYRRIYDAYCRIFERCGVPYRVVEAEAGPIGGSANHEFMVPSPTGEDLILESDKDNYAANMEKCETAVRQSNPDGPPTGVLEKIHTPDCLTIADVCKLAKIKPKHMLKSLVCHGETTGWVIAVVRGDHELNEAKLRTATGDDVMLAADDDARRAGFAIGFVGPQLGKDRNDVQIVIDFDAMQDQFWATGANETDYHVKHFNWHRDVIIHLPDRIKITDLRNAIDGDPSPKNDGGVLRETKGIEVGHVFKLGCRYSEDLGLCVLDENNDRKALVMGCYGIGVNRILAAAIEQKRGHDQNGIIWPASIAPYQVLITPIKYEGEVKETTDQLAMELERNGHDVLIDDRQDRPGVKFKDADLIGIPVRIIIGNKALKDANVEIKARTAEKPTLVAITSVTAHVMELVSLT